LLTGPRTRDTPVSSFFLTISVVIFKSVGH
jgi:hypothetical protein